ncbi:dendrin [Ara ararauna]
MQRIRERTQLLLLEIDTVACCSPPGAAMAAGCGPAPPWTYRRIAREYAYLEKSFVAELAPPWPPAHPHHLQDFTSRPPPACETRPRAPPTRCHPEGSRGWPPPCAPHAPVPGARPGPPSYEAHMQRVQAAHARRGGPPPYISPPAYDAPHRTLQLRPPRPLRSPLRAPRSRGAMPGGWSHTLPRAATEARLRYPRGMSPSPGGPGTPQHSQTLPRAAGSRARAPGGSRRQQEAGGHVLIDATRVVVRAQYVAPVQRQQVRYMGASPGPAAPPGSPPAAPGAVTPPARPFAGPGAPPQPLAQPRGMRGPARPVPAAAAGAVRAGAARGRVPHPPPHGPRFRLRGRGGAGGVPVAALPGPPHLQQQQQQPGEHRGPPGHRQPPLGLRGGAWRGVARWGGVWLGGAWG